MSHDILSPLQIFLKQKVTVLWFAFFFFFVLLSKAIFIVREPFQQIPLSIFFKSLVFGSYICFDPLYLMFSDDFCSKCILIFLFVCMCLSKIEWNSFYPWPNDGRPEVTLVMFTCPMSVPSQKVKEIYETWYPCVSANVSDYFACEITFTMENYNFTA